MSEPIFSKAFLEPYLTDFRLRSVTGIEAKLKTLRRWAEEISSGKIGKLKEEEIKSRFISEIFGTVLGFNLHNPLNWQVREEHKVVVGATKPDASIGYFIFMDGHIGNEVRVVVEVKNASTDLDKKQNRTHMLISPVEQAFLYASKSGGHCKWVIVTNLLSIRFYHYSGQQKFQEFNLMDLLGEESLKEFLLLFHKDRFTNSSTSATDKLFVLSRSNKTKPLASGHILDKMYQALFKFEGLGFVDPKYICNLKPFNLSDKHVWHFERGRMLTLNSEIGAFFSEVNYNDGKISFSTALEHELKKSKVLDAGNKARYVIDFLNNCMVSAICVPKDISAVYQRAKISLGFSVRHFHHFNDKDLLIFSTSSTDLEPCKCINCAYRSLNFKSLIAFSGDVIDSQNLEPLERGYLDYILATDNFKRSYFTFKHAERESKGEEAGHAKYFLSKINQMHLYNLVESYSDDNSEKNDILQDIRSIDLDHSIHNELDLYVSPELRRYLIEIKENKLLQGVSKKAEEILQKCIASTATGYDLQVLSEQYNYLYSHFHKNYLVFDTFTGYKDVVSKLIRAMLIAYSWPKGGLNSIGSFYVLEAALYVPPSDLKKYLEEIGDLVMDSSEKAQIISRTKSFLDSFYKTAFFGNVQESVIKRQLLNWNFKDKVTNIFSNLFQMLCKVDFDSQEIAVLSSSIDGFMSTEDFLAWYDLVPFSEFIERYGFILTKDQLERMLRKCISGDTYGTHKYHVLISGICKAFRNFYPDQSVIDHSIVHLAVANCMDSTGKCRLEHLIPLFLVLSEGLRKDLLLYFEKSLEDDFNDDIFYALIDANILTTEYKDYFKRWMETTERTKHLGFLGFKDGEEDYADTVLINVITRCYLYGIDLNRPEIKILTKLSNFESWALFPDTFDYDLFDIRWLLVVDRPFILGKLSHVKQIRTSLWSAMSKNFHPRLGQIFFEFFSRSIDGEHFA